MTVETIVAVSAEIGVGTTGTATVMSAGVTGGVTTGRVARTARAARGIGAVTTVAEGIVTGVGMNAEPVTTVGVARVIEVGMSAGVLMATGDVMSGAGAITAATGTTGAIAQEARVHGAGTGTIGPTPVSTLR